MSETNVRLPADRSIAFISWIRRHGRSADLASHLGATEVNIYREGLPTAVRYIYSSFATLSWLLRMRPAVVFVMQPPVFAILPAVAYTLLFKRMLAADLHSGFFLNPKWAWASNFALKLVKAAKGVCIVTNEKMAEIVASSGVECWVIHDPIPIDSDPGDGRGLMADLPASDVVVDVLVPLAYAFDEPVTEILAAARESPEISFFLTGHAPKEVKARAPGNVHFTGYVSAAAYADLVCSARCIIALTTSEDTMQRAGYEALAACKPLVTSSTEVLSDYFGEAAKLVNPTAQEISQGVAFALENELVLASLMRELRHKKEQEIALQVSDLLVRLSSL